MNRKRLIGVLIGAVALVAAVFVCAVIVYRSQQLKLSPPRPGEPDGTFVPLEELVQQELRFLEGWETHTLPKDPGPFRRSKYHGGSLSRGSGGSMKSTALSDDGKVEDEIELEASPDCDYLVRHIESESGRRCLLVLKRPR